MTAAESESQWSTVHCTVVSNLSDIVISAEKKNSTKLVDPQKSEFFSFETKTFKKIILHIFLLF